MRRHMPDKVHIHLNRCVHLARRNACFERGLELLCVPTRDLSARNRLEHIDRVVQLLKKANEHAYLAARATDVRPREKDFIHFLELILDAVGSIQFMMQHQVHLEQEESFLCRFLETNSEESLLPARHYQRRADDLMEGLWELFRLVAKPYRMLEDETAQDFSEDERKRYEHAYNTLRPELIELFPGPDNGS